jgi:predicted MFS family arabinose efflux permease
LVEGRRDLDNAIALNSSVTNVARLLGPAIAGFVIDAVGEGFCFLIDGASYFDVLASLWAMRVAPPAVAQTGASALAHLREGYVYVRSARPIRSILVLFCMTTLLGYPYTVLLPVFAAKVLHGGPHTLGYLTAASGVGALVSAVSLTLRESIFGLVRMLQVSAFVLGAALICFGLSQTLWLSLVMISFAGFGLIQGASASNTLIQSMVDEDKRGRVMSYYMMAFFGAAPLGSLVAGMVADWIGAPYTIVLTGLACLASAAWFTREMPKIAPTIRGMVPT